MSTTLMLVIGYVLTVVAGYILLKKAWLMDDNEWDVGSRRMIRAGSILGPIAVVIGILQIIFYGWDDSRVIK